LDVGPPTIRQRSLLPTAGAVVPRAAAAAASLTDRSLKVARSTQTISAAAAAAAGVATGDPADDAATRRATTTAIFLDRQTNARVQLARIALTASY